MYSDRNLLGQSKSGSVYKSVHPTTGQPVLLKIVPWDGAAPSPLNTEMLVAMAPQIMQVGGFNVARLLAVEQLDEGLALVSEYFQAPTISQHPEKGKISAKAALDIANQLINALCDGERLRLIHGDVKPSNVLIGAQPDGRPHVKLTDWGLNQTRADHPLETLLFTAPERLDGSGATLRADLFSVGSVLFFLLTGMTLVKGRNHAEISNAWAAAAPEHLKKIRKDLPPKFVKFLLTLLEMKPEKRPANPSAARNLLAELSPPALPQPAAAAPAARATATAPGAARPGAPGVVRPGVVRPGAAPAPAAANPLRVAPMVPPPVVPVQGPMRPPTTIIPPGTARVPATAQPDTATVQVVAMRPPPEIAAQLNLPTYDDQVMEAPPMIPAQPIQQAPPIYQAQPVYQPITPSPAGYSTQPFATGGVPGVHAGVRTQPIPSHQSVPHQNRGLSVAPGQAHPQYGRRPGMPPQEEKSKGPLFLILTLLVIVSMGVTGFFVWKNWDKLSKPEPTEQGPKNETSSELKERMRALDNKK